MTIPADLTFEGDTKEFQFRDKFVMPLLLRLGFGIVVNYHGQREFGRDVIFGDLDRFGHVVYYGMQIKYEASISLADSSSLIQDAEQATNNPFRHPQTGREEFISSFYVANAGAFSDQGRENFFNSIMKLGIRDARLLDGNALLLLDKAASLRRTENIKERLTGLLQEIRRNRKLVHYLALSLRANVADPSNNPYPMQRCRNTATAAYLDAPFKIANLAIDVVDQYWEQARIINDLADSVGVSVTAGNFRSQRADAVAAVAPQIESNAAIIESAAMQLLNQLGKAS